MAARRTYFWQRLASFVLLGAGFAIVWCLVAAFVVDSMFGYDILDGRVVERVQVLTDGEPTIVGTRYRRTGVVELPPQTLDRRPLELGERSVSPVVRFNRIYLTLNQVDSTHGYAVRVLQVGDQRLQLTDDYGTARWYAVRDASEEGRAYLVGYDVAAKLPVGYIGRGGFRNAPPDSADQFVVGDLPRRTATVALPLDDQDAAVAYAYLLDGDRLVEVDTMRHTVREVVELPGALMMDVALRSRRISKEEAVDGDRIRMERSLVVWQGVRFSVVDPKTGDVDAFRLPDEVQDAEGFGIHVVGPETAVIEHYPGQRNFSKTELKWTTPDGDVTREETVTVSGYPRPSERVEFMKGVAAIPVPLLFGAIVPLVVYFDPPFPEKSFGEGLADAVATGWPSFGLLLLVSAALAGRVWRMHRWDGRPNPGLWAGLVFLFGPPAWLAYVAERTPTPAATCPACGTRSPRNRVDCSACGEDAFLPRRLGTEVFA
jgi:hypothetical protein